MLDFAGVFFGTDFAFMFGWTRKQKNLEEYMGYPQDHQCDQCCAVIINGVFCHEHGCPNRERELRYQKMMKEEDDG